MPKKIKVMKTSYKFIYFLTSMITYIVIGLLEFFVFDNLLDMLSTKYSVHALVMILCLIFINPLITYALVGKLPLKPTKRINGTLKDDLKRVTR